MKAPRQCRNVGRKMCIDSEKLDRQYLMLLSELSKGKMDQIASLREMAAGPRSYKVENVEL
jgi:hypothetical protein